MRHANTDPKGREKRGALGGFLIFCLLQAACTVGFAALGWIPGLPGWAQILFYALAAFCAMLVLPALAALKGRWKEISQFDVTHT